MNDGGEIDEVYVLGVLTGALQRLCGALEAYARKNVAALAENIAKIALLPPERRGWRIDLARTQIAKCDASLFMTAVDLPSQRPLCAKAKALLLAIWRELGDLRLDATEKPRSWLN
jgi:hypothetical protein